MTRLIAIAVLLGVSLSACEPQVLVIYPHPVPPRAHHKEDVPPPPPPPPPTAWPGPGR